MNRKFLSAILFGALMVTSTGTFVSCKDYDDDIDDLQAQIDKLATKDDLSAQIATLQAALSTASSNASEAITKANAAEAAAKAAGNDAAAAEAAAEKAAEEAKAAAIEGVQGELDDLKAELDKLVSDGLGENESALKEMNKKVEEATAKVEEIVGKIADMVTSVELVYSNGVQENSYFTYIQSYESNYETHINTFSRDMEDLYDEDGNWIGYKYRYTYDKSGYNGQTLQTRTIVEQDNKFGTETSFITFTKGTQVQKGDKFIVRVSPTNAVLTPEMITLVNSLGEPLDLLEVKSVKHYNGLLTRGVEENGLWEVEVALKEYDADVFNATVFDAYGWNIAYAVAVNNTLSTASTRQVISSYDLAVQHVDFSGLNRLNYYVDGIAIDRINNRTKDNYSQSLETYWSDKCKTEYVWSGAASTTPVYSGAGQNTYIGDNRGSYMPYPAVQGVPMTITLTRWIYSDGYVSDASAYIRAMYVTLDTENAVESAPSELNAWNSYTYTGLNTVVEGTSTTITINSTTAINDIIGFRVYAVNWDGTLVDPDGRAFYVSLGDVATDWGAVATTVKAGLAAPTACASGKQAVTLSKLTEPVSYTWTTDKCASKHNSPIFNVYFENADGTIKWNTTQSVSGVDFSKFTKVYTKPTCGDWLDYVDNKAYNGTLVIKNATDHVLATMSISMTKTLPTTMPEGYSLKDKQVIDGVYNCYMIADSWAANTANNGTMPIENLINWGKGDTTNGANYVVTFATSTVDANGAAIAKQVAGNGTLTVAKSYVDNATQHATTVAYNYGKISTETKDANGNVVDYKVVGDTFQTVYCCFYKKDVHTWSWVDKAPTKLTYGNPIDDSGAPKATAAYDQYIKGTNAIDGIFTTLLSKVYENSLEIKSASLISDNTGKEDYFSVSNKLEFTPIKIDEGSNPKANVPSTLIVNCKDSYGHDVVIRLAMTVAPR